MAYLILYFKPIWVYKILFTELVLFKKTPLVRVLKLEVKPASTQRFLLILLLRLKPAKKCMRFICIFIILLTTVLIFVCSVILPLISTRPTRLHAFTKASFIAFKSALCSLFCCIKSFIYEFRRLIGIILISTLPVFLKMIKKTPKGEE